jgi:hypothetical protein
MTSFDNLSDASGAARDESHNTQINTAAAQAHRCGMTHLATGRVCLLPERHPGSCDFRHRQNDVESVVSQA